MYDHDLDCPDCSRNMSVEYRDQVLDSMLRDLEDIERRESLSQVESWVEGLHHLESTLFPEPAPEPPPAAFYRSFGLFVYAGPARPQQAFVAFLVSLAAALFVAGLWLL
jgi:hypothetical protein